jgi:hypothetical protein
MADTPGWVQVRPLGPKDDVKALAQMLAAGHEVKADSGSCRRNDREYQRIITVRRPAEVADA